MISRLGFSASRPPAMIKLGDAERQQHKHRNTTRRAEVPCSKHPRTRSPSLNEKSSRKHTRPGHYMCRLKVWKPRPKPENCHYGFEMKPVNFIVFYSLLTLMQISIRMSPNRKKIRSSALYITHGHKHSAKAQVSSGENHYSKHLRQLTFCIQCGSDTEHLGVWSSLINFSRVPCSLRHRRYSEPARAHTRSNTAPLLHQTHTHTHTYTHSLTL